MIVILLIYIVFYDELNTLNIGLRMILRTIHINLKTTPDLKIESIHFLFIFFY